MQSVLRWCFVAIPLLALLPRGAVSIEAQAVFAGFTALLSLVVIGFAQRPLYVMATLRNTVALFLFLALLIGFQAYLPFPGAFADAAWAAANSVTGGEGAVISVAPADTIASLLQISAPFLLFCNGLLIFRTDDDAVWAVGTLARAGGVLAALALLQYMSFADTLLLWQKRFYLDSFTSTFVNRNTAATFLGLVILVLAGLIVDAVLRRRHRLALALIMGQRLASPERRKAWKLLFDVILLGLSTVGLLLTVSRAGTLSVFLALVLLLVLAAADREAGGEGLGVGRLPQRRAIRFLRIAGIVLGTTVVLVAFAGQVLLRADVGGLSDPRFCIYPSILTAIGQNWLSGTGFGAFLQSFAAFRPPECGLYGVWDRAHSVYLEAMLGLGVAAVPVLATGLVLLSRILVSGLRARRRLRIYPVIGIAILAMTMVHSVLDFSLQLPGMALFFSAAMAPIVTICLARQISHNKA
ncbi:O-antigen ligase family protein [Ciceribacter sp. L1K22]|uniref:O-antigen ligase family protein n=1 Tax=Ciceribacter sp. L1K22 TaxID=2820275 RepID=UPI001ABECA8A|nr:O-antigen ligase family protein [Ciceribacter sp. L1K22]